MDTLHVLNGIAVVNAGVNLPVIAAAARLAELGASVTKVEPPGGDPSEALAESLYRHHTEGQTVIRLDLKADEGQAAMSELLAGADVLLTSSRPSALARIGLAPAALLARHPRLVQVAIVGHAAPRQELAGHDLTYVARHGLLSPPALPRTLLADLGGAERAATAVLALLLARERGLGGRYAEVALDESAAFFATVWAHGVTAAHGPLGGREPFYGVYESADGWVALAALEPHFRTRVVAELGITAGTAGALAEAFRQRSSDDWERWAEVHDLPIAAVARGSDRRDASVATSRTG
jgi:crotonobetainyl-CoA:carnitine CoA-transferase CaiB-like acyl-CoA transferase